MFLHKSLFSGSHPPSSSTKTIALNSVATFLAKGFPWKRTVCAVREEGNVQQVQHLYFAYLFLSSSWFFTVHIQCISKSSPRPGANPSFLLFPFLLVTLTHVTQLSTSPSHFSSLSLFFVCLHVPSSPFVDGGECAKHTETNTRECGCHPDENKST